MGVAAGAWAWLLCSCASPRFRAVDFEAGLARAKATPAYSDSSNRDHSLVSFDVVTLGSLVPDPWSIKEAVGNIEANASGNPGQWAGAISLATWEHARVYLGDTFERAYASFVGSMAYWMLGEDDNAAALWRNALDIDRESDPGFQNDFAVVNYLLAKYTWNLPGQRDNAALYLTAARAVWPGNPYLAPERLENDNLIVLVEVGDGPRKIATGPQGSVLDFEPGQSRFGEVEIQVDDGPITLSSQILDLYLQAKHSMRPTGKEALQVIKGTAVAAGVGYGVYKLTDDPTLGFLAAFLLQLMPADTRQWWGVPGQVQLASFRVESGPHRLRLRATTSFSYLLASQPTDVLDLEVSSRHDTLVLIRPVYGLPERHAAPPPDVPRETGVVADANALAVPGSPIVDLDSISPVLRRLSPLYKYLPSREEIRLEPVPEGVAPDAEPRP